jgi:hypothetical protein
MRFGPEIFIHLSVPVEFAVFADVVLSGAGGLDADYLVAKLFSAFVAQIEREVQARAAKRDSTEVLVTFDCCFHVSFFLRSCLLG